MEKLLGYNELADILGVSKRTVEFWVSAKKIPFIKLGEKNSSVRFALSEVEGWLKLKRVGPVCLQ